MLVGSFVVVIVVVVGGLHTKMFLVWFFFGYFFKVCQFKIIHNLRNGARAILSLGTWTWF